MDSKINPDCLCSHEEPNKATEVTCNYCTPDKDGKLLVACYENPEDKTQLYSLQINEGNLEIIKRSGPVMEFELMLPVNYCYECGKQLRTKETEVHHGI